MKIGNHNNLQTQSKPALIKIASIFFCLAIFTINSKAQEDSAKNLSEVLVKAFEQNKQLSHTSAAINYIGPSQLARFSNTNILPAMNSTPGVRMEERSPASYRLNIRGSTLRSPFGVRNVKIYFDEIPYTDAGGNSYLNQLSFYNFNSIEIIKGPGGSLYGAGTGGVMLIQSQPSEWKKDFQATISGGSYGLFAANAQARMGSEKFQNYFNYAHQNSEGYRHHTSMRRDVGNWQMKLVVNKKEDLKFSLLYGDLYYQTPGALTKTEYNINGRASRPKAGTLPSADSAKAAIFQKMLLGGISNEYKFSDQFENRTTIYASSVEVKNPTFRNYEKRKEPQWGARTVFKWKQVLSSSALQLIFGGEIQRGNFNTKTFTNVQGEPGNLQTNDDITPSIYSVFAQADLHLNHDWNFTAGLSLNQASIEINRISVPNFKKVNREFNNELAPRIALSKKLFSNFWIYSSVSKGFSPPTVAEILPSTTVISTDLQPEHGINYEFGVKTSWLDQRLYMEVNAFYYRLENAIVQRKDSNNADYFVNAGSTKQSGIESQLSYQFVTTKVSTIQSAKIWAAYTWNKFNYDVFKQGTIDYSGKQLPSVAPNTIAAGFDIKTKIFYSNLSYFYSDHIPLNDANSEYASSYNLLSLRIGKENIFKTKFHVFAGVENILDAKYSLGNDINAAGGRYYNQAAGRSYYLGVSVIL